MTYWAAREFVGQYLPATPLIRVERLSEILGCDYYVKCENLQPVVAFKVRGGVNLVGTASEEEKQAGLVSASTGNHGQSIAYAGRLFGARVIIYAPAENVNQTKIQAMRDLAPKFVFTVRERAAYKILCIVANAIRFGPTHPSRPVPDTISRDGQ